MQKSIWVLLISSFFHFQAQAGVLLPISVHSDSTLLIKPMTTHQGDVKWVELLVPGHIKLYREAVSADNFVAVDNRTVITQDQIAYRYWIGTDRIEPIDRLNYRPLIKSYMPEAKTLHKRLGKYGFRFENLPSMIVYYNQFYAGDGEPMRTIEKDKLKIW